MRYDVALRKWGALKVSRAYNIDVDDIVETSVRVEFDFDEGYNCCGGSDPNCYCSFAESPSAEVVVTAATKNDRTYRWSMDVESFDFATVLAELCEVGSGSISSV